MHDHVPEGPGTLGVALLQVRVVRLEDHVLVAEVEGDRFNLVEQVIGEAAQRRAVQTPGKIGDGPVASVQSREIYGNQWQPLERMCACRRGRTSPNRPAGPNLPYTCAVLPVALETVFRVPLLNQNSVARGGCCPVPAEAIILPELELVPGVQEADADWQAAEVRVRHTARVDPAEMARLLADLSYPAEAWQTRPV